MFKVLLLVSLLTVSCGTSKFKLSHKGKKVEVAKTEPGKKCSVIAKVVGENDGGSAELAKNHARNLVGNKGGNVIIFNEEVVNGKSYRVHSTGYACKK